MYKFEGNGQINMNQDFGHKIYDICKNPKIKTIVEVGTWNGQGSTVCIMNGIINKNAVLYSLEANKSKYDEAVLFWNKYETFNKLNLLYGTLHKEKFIDLNVLQKIGITEEAYIYHYVPEKAMIEDETVPLITLNDLKIDCILLDGGEYTTIGDFNVLIKFNPKVIILDDSAVYKCKEIRETLFKNNKYTCYHDNLNDRHGATIFVENGFFE